MEQVSKILKNIKPFWGYLFILALYLNFMSCTKASNEFLTPDLALFALKDKVKECQTNFYKAIEKDGQYLKGEKEDQYRSKSLKYSILGELIFTTDYDSLNNKSNTVKRNTKGRITEISNESPWIEEGGTYTQGEVWEYDNYGRPCRHIPYDDVEADYADDRIEYDNENNIIRIEDKGRFPSTTTYQYIEFDQHNNWIKRVSACLNEFDQTKKVYEERNITYY